ncbi:MAG: hypothetical protein HC904_10705 [Blastochloris sp.]|nr:hypothetical protein [Blastochloris sp.]
MLFTIGELRAEIAPDVHSILSSLSNNFRELKSIEFKCEGRGKGYANEKVSHVADLLIYKSGINSFYYSYQNASLRVPEEFPQWSAQRTLAYDGETLQIMLHPEALMQVTKKAGVEALNFDYGRTKNQGLFEPYIILALLYHAEMVQAKETGHLKLSSPNSQGYYPLMADYLTALEILRKEKLPSTNISCSKLDSDQYVLVASKIIFAGQPNTMRVFFRGTSLGMPYRWELIAAGDFHPNMIWEGEATNIKNQDSFSYYLQHTKKCFLNTKHEKDKPKLIAEQTYNISECQVNKILDEASFSIDPTIADLILDIDENQWIRVPK